MSKPSSIAIGLLADVTLGKMLQTAPKSGDDKLRPYLRAAHVQPDGVLDLSVEPHEMWFAPNEADQLDLRTGDTVVVEGGVGGYGRAAYVSNDLPGMGFQNSIIRLRADSAADGRYLAHALVSARNNRQIEMACMNAAMPHFTAEKVARFRVPFHEPEDRRRIADYLDRETRKIDVMLSRLGDLTEALNARRISVIRRATQFGPNGRLWETVPTAHLFGNIGSGTTPKDQRYYTEHADGIPWVTTSELRESVITGSNQRVTREAVAEVSSLKIHPAGAVLIAMYGATIGRLGTLGIDAAVNQACCAFSDPRGIDMRFFYYTLLGQRDDIVLLAVGGGQPNISQTMLRRWRVPCPPQIMQKSIADRLDEATTRIDAMLAKVADLKSLLLERRTALITDVVTGNREAA